MSTNELKHFLGNCMCDTRSMSCWFWYTASKQRDLGQDDSWFDKQQEQAIEAYIAERTLEGRLVELDLLEQALNGGYNLNTFKRKRLHELITRLDALKSNERKETT